MPSQLNPVRLVAFHYKPTLVEFYILLYQFQSLERAEILLRLTYLCASRYNEDLGILRLVTTSGTADYASVSCVKLSGFCFRPFALSAVFSMRLNRQNELRTLPESR